MKNIKKILIGAMFCGVLCVPTLLSGCNFSKDDESGFDTRTEIVVPADIPETPPPSSSEPEVPEEPEEINFGTYFTGTKAISSNNFAVATLTEGTDAYNYANYILDQTRYLSREILYSLCGEYGMGVSTVTYNSSIFGSSTSPLGISADITPYLVDNGNGFLSEHSNYDAIRQDAWVLRQGSGLAYNVSQWNYISAYSGSQTNLTDNLNKLMNEILKLQIGSTDATMNTGDTQFRELGKMVSHIGYTSAEKEMLKQYIFKNIIGEEVLARDNQKFYDNNANGRYDEGDVIKPASALNATTHKDNRSDPTVLNSGYNSFDNRVSMFKNYQNIVDSIVDRITARLDTSTYMPVYPTIAGVKYIDNNSSTTTLGMDKYKSVVLSAKAETDMCAFKFNLNLKSNNNGTVVVKANLRIGNTVRSVNLATVNLTANTNASTLVDIKNIIELNNSQSSLVIGSFVNNNVATSMTYLMPTSTNVRYFNTSPIENSTDVNVNYVDDSTNYLEFCFESNNMIEISFDNFVANV